MGSWKLLACPEYPGCAAAKRSALLVECLVVSLAVICAGCGTVAEPFPAGAPGADGASVGILDTLRSAEGDAAAEVDFGSAGADTGTAHDAADAESAEDGASRQDDVPKGETVESWPTDSVATEDALDSEIAPADGIAGDASVTDASGGIGSCIGRCGTFDAAASCQCDPMCGGYDDCCPDFDTVCATEPVDALDAIPEDTAVADGGLDATTADAVASDDGGGDAVAGSCAEKCGVYEVGASCQCDADCSNYGDCCEDYVKACGSATDSLGGQDVAGEVGGGTSDAADTSIGADSDSATLDGSVAADTDNADAVVDAADVPPKLCVPGDCDDGNMCTEDLCLATTGCQHASLDGAACSDGDSCTTDSCLGGNCTGKPLDCSDGDDCTLDSCSPSTGACSHQEIPGCALADLTVTTVSAASSVFPVMKKVTVTYTETNVGKKATGPYTNVVLVSSTSAMTPSNSVGALKIDRPSLAAGAARTETVTFVVPPVDKAYGADHEDAVGVYVDSANVVDEPGSSAGGKPNLGVAKVDLQATDLVAGALSAPGTWKLGSKATVKVSWSNKLSLPPSTYGSFKVLLFLSGSSSPSSGPKVLLWQTTSTLAKASVSASFTVKAPKPISFKQGFWLHLVVDADNSIPEPEGANNHTASTVWLAP